MALDLVVRIVAIIVVPRNRRPTAGMAWLLAIFFIPVPRHPVLPAHRQPQAAKGRREKQEEVDGFIRERTHGVERVSDSSDWPSWFDGVVQLNRNLGAMPLIGSNSASLIGDYQGSLAAMAEAISGVAAVRPRRVLHLRLRPHHRPVLRCARRGGRTAAWR